MSLLVDFSLIMGGFLVILFLAEIAVKLSIKLAEHWGLSGSFIGLTILSIGTSIPEIMSAVAGSLNILERPAELQKISGILLGQNVGSDIFQQTILLGTVGLLGTVVVVKKDLLSEVGALIAGAVLMWIMTIGGVITQVEGIIMLLAYGAYLIYLERRQSHHHPAKRKFLKTSQVWFNGTAVLISFVAMAFAANLVIETSTKLVDLLPFSASFFGVLLLGVASALPELTTAMVAMFKHKRDVSAGVLIGSNVTNPLFGIGLGAAISGFAVPDVVKLFDLPMKIGIALVLFYFLWRNEKLNKWEAVVMILLFAVYLFLRSIYFPVDF